MELSWGRKRNWECEETKEKKDSPRETRKYDEFERKFYERLIEGLKKQEEESAKEKRELEEQEQKKRLEKPELEKTEVQDLKQKKNQS